MAPLKSPGVDGFHARFYQPQWDIVGSSVFSMVRQVFRGYLMDHRINKTLLVLIPKVDSPERITQFRPISLCTVLYKIITKAIVNRMRLLMSRLTQQNQASFMMGGSISDNIVIA